ncbi:MAG: adenylate kinase [Acidobacteria bacterium]|nr:adenylate kinase [Acidobacteriota bacterium]
MSLNVIMLGPPASGKGTQAVRLAQARGIPRISTGDILREAGQAGTEFGLRAKALMDRGELVSDDVMVDIVRERLSQPDAKDGFILDGFPRTVGQAQTLDRILQGQPLVIIDLAVSDSELIHRMRGRRVCSKCGANAEPPAEASLSNDTCRRCGGQITTRADDGDEAVRQHRLQVYARESKPLLDYYRSRPTFRSIDGAQPTEEVSANLVSAIDSLTQTAVRAGSTGTGSAR